LFNISSVSLLFGAGGDLETNRLLELAFERGHVPVGRPELELGVATRPKPREVVVSARKQIDRSECLRMAAVEAFGQPHDGRQHAHAGAQRPVQFPVPLV
jgi:hypothetical protein